MLFRSRVLEDKDIKTACQQACPSEAIVFGNVNDPNSAISQTRSANQQRMFYALEQIHVLPNINYLTKVRNTATLAAHEAEEAHSAEAKQS